MPYENIYRPISSQNVSYAASGGASAQSSAFGSQTRIIAVCAVGIQSATLDGVRVALGSNPTAAATSMLIPLNQSVLLKCGPGEKLAVLGNNTGTGTVSVTELA